MKIRTDFLTAINQEIASINIFTLLLDDKMKSYNNTYGPLTIYAPQTVLYIMKTRTHVRTAIHKETASINIFTLFWMTKMIIPSPLPFIPHIRYRA